MAFPDRRTANVLLTILLFVVVLAIIYAARRVIVIFAFAILFAYLIDPVVRFLQRHSLFFKNLRGPHILEAYLALLILIALAPHAIAPGLLRQTGKLFREIPALRHDVSTGEIVTKLGSKYRWTDDRQRRVKSFLAQHRTDIQGFLAAAERIVPDALGSLVLIPILAIFFLSSGGYLADSLVHHVSTKDNFEAVQSLARELNVTLQHYIRAKVTLSGLSFIYCSTTMLLLGFPRALALGILAGVLEFIPVAGWVLSATTIISVGVLTHSHWIRMAALLGVWRVLMDYAIAPGVMGHELEIHPLLAIFTIMVGAAIGGIVGVYLSIPLVAVLRVVWRRFVLASPHAERVPVSR
jgi:predicted PurR-regulated permease PerM